MAGVHYTLYAISTEHLHWIQLIWRLNADLRGDTALLG
jgi:hypothetical protein